MSSQVKLHLPNPQSYGQSEKLMSEVRSLRDKVIALALVALISLVVAIVALTSPQTSDAGAATGQETPSVLLSTSHQDSNIPSGYSLRSSIFKGTGQWADKGNMPKALSDFQVVSAMKGAIEHIFIIGGVDIMGAGSSNLTIWDPLLQQYTEGTPMPEPRIRFAAAALNGKIYVMGGFTDPAEFVATNKTLVYDIATDVWAQGQDAMINYRSDACAATIDDSIYLVGGYDTQNDYSPVQILEVLTPGNAPLTASFSQGPNMPTGRGDVSCANINGLLGVIGGWTADWSSPRGTFETYDPATQTWMSRPDVPNPRGDGAMATLTGGRLIMVSGEIAARSRTQIPQHEVDMFVLEENVWIEVAPISTARFRHAVVAVDDVLYAIGGQEVCGYIYNPVANLTEKERLFRISSCPETALSSIEAYLTVFHSPLYYYARD